MNCSTAIDKDIGVILEHGGGGKTSVIGNLATIQKESKAAANAVKRTLTCEQLLIILFSNTPAMPLKEAHFGGFFVSGAA